MRYIKIKSSWITARLRPPDRSLCWWPQFNWIPIEIQPKSSHGPVRAVRLNHERIPTVLWSDHGRITTRSRPNSDQITIEIQSMPTVLSSRTRLGMHCAFPARTSAQERVRIKLACIYIYTTQLSWVTLMCVSVRNTAADDRSASDFFSVDSEWNYIQPLNPRGRWQRPITVEFQPPAPWLRGVDDRNHATIQAWSERILSLAWPRSNSD